MEFEARREKVQVLHLQVQNVIRNSQETLAHNVFYIAAFTESVDLERLSPT